MSEGGKDQKTQKSEPRFRPKNKCTAGLWCVGCIIGIGGMTVCFDKVVALMFGCSWIVPKWAAAGAGGGIGAMTALTEARDQLCCCCPCIQSKSEVVVEQPVASTVLSDDILLQNTYGATEAAEPIMQEPQDSGENFLVRLFQETGADGAPAEAQRKVSRIV